MNSKRESYMQDPSSRPQNAEFTTQRLKNSGLRNLQARVSSVNAKIAFSEHERMDLNLIV